MIGLYERVPLWLCHKVWVVAAVEGDGDLGPLYVLSDGDLPGFEFLLPL
jgi:hypothetical protein